MFDIGALELLVLVVVAIIVIGPKDMPAALRVVGRWVGKLRRASSQFRTGFDNIVREAEMEDMEKKWKEQNAKIMAETPHGEMEPLPADAESAVPSKEQSDTGPSQAAAAKPKPSAAVTKKSAAKSVKKPSAKAKPAKPQASEPMLPLDKTDSE